MPKLTTENTLVLPEKHAGVGPHDHEAAWFRKSLLEPGNDREIIDAIIAKGIGSRPCPTPRDWAAFAVAGSVIAALTDKYITPPDPEPPEWVAYEMVHMLWGTLWQSVRKQRRARSRSTGCDSKGVSTTLERRRPILQRKPRELL